MKTINERRVCVLTGAGGVLGNAFCQAFADRFDIVAVHGRRPPTVVSQQQQLIDPLAPHQPLSVQPVHAMRADLADARDRARVVEVALARYGTIDVLVNAAVHYVMAPLVDSDRTLDSLAAQFEVNLFAPVHLAVLMAREVWRDQPRVNRERRRNVINVSSLAGVHVIPDGGRSAYSAAKAALNMFSHHLAYEFAGFGVRVNVTAPGSFPDPVPMRLVLESITQLDGSDITGRVLAVDQQGISML